MVKYYTQEEIAFHNHGDDCWVTIFDDVYDITELLKNYRGPLSIPLLEAAGSSISHWFNKKTGDLKTYIDPVRNIEMPYTPQGRFVHVPPSDPLDFSESVALPWWKDARYIIGKVSMMISAHVQKENYVLNCIHIVRCPKRQ
jgi:cytochrome b involved in lipid metabolism